jgi:hypothetical protein
MKMFIKRYWGKLNKWLEENCKGKLKESNIKV